MWFLPHETACCFGNYFCTFTGCWMRRWNVQAVHNKVNLFRTEFWPVNGCTLCTDNGLPYSFLLAPRAIMLKRYLMCWRTYFVWGNTYNCWRTLNRLRLRRWYFVIKSVRFQRSKFSKVAKMIYIFHLSCMLSRYLCQFWPNNYLNLTKTLWQNNFTSMYLPLWLTSLWFLMRMHSRPNGENGQINVF